MENQGFNQPKNGQDTARAVLELRGLEAVYETDDGIVRAVNGINFSIAERETIGLVGETGAGKTTTALSILRLLPERTGRIPSGQILYKGQDLLKKSEDEMRLIRGACISMIFQDPMTALNPILTVGDQILESLEVHNAENRTHGELESRVDELLSLVGISPGRKKEYPHQFSGGMKQRIVIAIALACEPLLLIADEPTTALDVTIQAQVLVLMDELRDKLGTSMIMITHDLGVVANTCDKVAIMYAGEIVEYGSVHDIFENGTHHPYTTGLFQAIPNMKEDVRRLHPIEGLMPDPSDLPSGCKFHPRCPKRFDECNDGRPYLYERGGHRIFCNLFREGFDS
ncbi:MAG: ABC transporter ATP-binding protein [Synergistaceae bacterium]|jgi:peptide/nickel transport system ATP-binding protein|nr:ABC transporter ATP-binding protein [Synergistaceae bacterium]